MDYDIDTKDLLSSLRQIEKGSLLPAYKNEIQDKKILRKRKKIGQTIPGKKNITLEDTESTRNSERNDPNCNDGSINVLNTDLNMKQLIGSPTEHDQFIKVNQNPKENGGAQSKEDFLTVKPPPMLRTQGNDDSNMLFDEQANILFLLSDNDTAFMTDNCSLMRESYSHNKKSKRSNYTDNVDMNNDTKKTSESSMTSLLLTDLKAINHKVTKKYKIPHSIENLSSVGKYSFDNDKEQNKISSNLLINYNSTQSAYLENKKSVEKALNDAIKLLPASMIKDKNNLIKINQRNKALLKALLSYDIIRKALLLKNWMRWKQNDYELMKIILHTLNESSRILNELKITAASFLSNRIYSYTIRLKYLEILNSRKIPVLSEAEAEIESVDAEVVEDKMEEKIMNLDSWKDGQLESSIIEFERTVGLLQSRWKRYLEYARQHKLQYEELANKAAVCISKVLRHYIIYKKEIRLQSVQLFDKQVLSTLMLQNIVRIYLAKIKLNRQKKLRNRRKLQEKYLIERNVVAFHYEQQGAAYAIQKWFLNLRYRRKRLYNMKINKWEIKQPRIEEDFYDDDFVVQPLSRFSKLGKNFSNMGMSFMSHTSNQSIRSMTALG